MGLSFLFFTVSSNFFLKEFISEQGIKKEAFEVMKEYYRQIDEEQK